MAKAKESTARAQSPVKMRKESHNGVEVLYPVDSRQRKIFIAGRPVTWGRAGDRYYLSVYAYDRGRTLEETVKRYLGYREKCKAQSKGRS